MTDGTEDYVWGQDYKQITADPDKMRDYADSCDSAGTDLVNTEDVFRDKAKLDPEVFSGWLELINNMGGGSEMKTKSLVTSTVYSSVVEATATRVGNIGEYLQDLGTGIRHTAQSVEDQDVYNADSMSTTDTGDVTGKPGQTGL